MTEKEPTRSAWSYPKTSITLLRTLREAWRLLSGAGLSVKDVARQLGIPANTVSKIKRRMESRLAAMFGMYE